MKARNIVTKIFFCVLAASIFTLFTVLMPSRVEAQATDVGGAAPNTTDVVNAALASGATPQQAAQAGVDYLASQGFSATITPGPSGSTIIGCDNGAQVIIPGAPVAPPPAAPPPAAPPPAAPPPPPDVNICEQNPAFCVDAQLPPELPPPGPACGVPCAGDFACQGAKDGCTVCINNTCQPPPAVPTATPTPARVCGSPCQIPADCQGALNCNLCTNNVCSAPLPTATPFPTATPTPIRVCGSPCQIPADCQGALNCNLCTNNVCSAPLPTATPFPTATPTPTPIPFNPDSCKCDGIEYSNLATGQKATITSFGKVEGADIPRSQIIDQSFYLYEGAETTATRIMSANAIPATIVSQDAGKVRYKSVWQFTMPQLKNGFTYRIQSKINCQPKLAVMNYSRPNVLAAETSNKGFFGGILDFLAGLFGMSSNTTAPTPTPTPIIFNTQDTQVTPGGNQLQLGTFLPLEIYQKTCTFIKFRVGLQ